MVAVVAKREIFIPEGGKQRKKSTRIANALAIEMLNYGINVDGQIVARIARHKRKDAERYADAILKMFTIGEANPPLFPEWESRTIFSLEERMVQIFGYCFQLSGNDLADPEYMERLKENVGFKKLKQLDLATSARAKTRFHRLVNSKVALDRASQTDLSELAQAFDPMAPRRIASAEARIAVLLGMVDSGMSLSNALALRRATPADVLRFAAAKLDFEGVKLPADVKYASLNWRERVSVLEFLKEVPLEELCEAMGNNRSAWTRFFQHVHLFRQRDFRKRFPDVVAAGLISVGSKLERIPSGDVMDYIEGNSEFYDITDSGNLAFRTFASRMQSAVDAKDFAKFKAEIKKRPSYLLRNIGTLSNVCTRETESAFVDLVRQFVTKANAGVLFSIIQIDIQAEYRIIDSKGNTTVSAASYSPVIGEAQGVAEREIYRRYGLAGKVEVQEKLKAKVVPFLSTNAELDRGTRIPFDGSKYLYFLMHWVQQSRRRTDLDHSYVCFDQDWNSETIYFGNQANSFIRQSGDITNAPAPRGGTEYGQIHLAKIPAHVRYIVPIINVFDGDVFSENETAYAGFMFSNNPKFSISRKHVRYDLSQPANSNIPFVIDVQAKEIVIVDFNNRNRNGLTAHSSVGEIRKVISALKTKRFMTMERFADMLSGGDATTSLTITSYAKRNNEMEPKDLQSLIV